MGRIKRRTLAQLLIACGMAVAMLMAFVAVGGVSSGPHGLAFAKGNHTAGGIRPGWGCGDTNHTHTGPPGNPGATSPCGTSTTSTATGARTSAVSTSTSTGGSGGSGNHQKVHTHSSKHQHAKHASHKKHHSKKHKH